MIIIEFTVKKQRLRLETDLRHLQPISDTNNYFKCHFDFDDSWEGFEKRIYFKNASFNITKAVLPDDAGYCFVPSEVLANTGVVLCTVTGVRYNGTNVAERITAGPVQFFVRNIAGRKPVDVFVQREEAIIQPDDPNITPTEYEQFVGEVKIYSDLAKDYRDAAEQAELKIENMTASAETGEPGSYASVTKVEYDDHYELAFTIPRGAEPVITATKNSETGTTVIYCDGVAIATILDGDDGETPDIATYRDTGVTYITSNGVTIGAVYDGDKGDPGADGQDGADGFSPIANVSKVGDTATITITDSLGTTTATVEDGADGQDGQDGADGHSPVITANKVGKVTTIYADGVAIATINDGQDGGGSSGDNLTLSLEGTDPETGANFFDLENLDTGNGLIIHDSNHWETYIGELQADKQDELISGTNIKTINNNSLLGSGNISIVVPDELADLSDDSTHRLVTDTEKSTWNGKSDFSGDYDDLTNKPTIPQDKVYIAAKDDMTYADVTQALADGKVIVMVASGIYTNYYYFYQDSSTNAHFFTRVSTSSNGIMRYRLDSTDTWVQELTTYIKTTDKPIVVDNFTISSRSFPANAAYWFASNNIDIPTKAGYTAVGIVGASSSSNYILVNPLINANDATKLYGFARNLNTSAVTTSIEISVLYVKSDLL